MKKIFTFAGPIAGLVALKCPFCLLALAGLGAGVGSLMPVVQGLYWIVILGLGAAFILFLVQSWKTNKLPGWIPVLGAAGFANLIYQVATEAEGVLAWTPSLLLTAAALCSFFFRRKSLVPCCDRSVPMKEMS